MKGNVLMIAIKVNNVYVTIAQATGHKLSVNNQLADTKTKDIQGKLKEITGRSWSLTTDNLVCVFSEVSSSAIPAIHVKNLKTYLKQGTVVDIALAYSSTKSETRSFTIDEIFLTGKALVTKIDENFPNKENATFNAEFQGKGPYTVPE